jgi:DNA-directed RNA polymerase subunit E"
MTRKKVCKSCKRFYEGSECPLCKGNQIGSSWQGRINVLDANKSEIAKKIGIKVKGEYAIKVR